MLTSRCCRPACGQLYFDVAVQGVLTFIVQEEGGEGNVSEEDGNKYLNVQKEKKIHCKLLRNGFYTKRSCSSTMMVFTVCLLQALHVNVTKQT